MRYMLLIYGDEHALDETEREECYRESTQLAHQIESAGSISPPPRSTRRRRRPASACATASGWSPTVPFAETREQLGGYFLIDAKDLDEAIAIAARIPMARRGTVEIRPVIERAGLPTAG